MPCIPSQFPDEDTVYRSAIHSVAFKSKGKRFDPTRFMALRAAPGNPNTLETSVVCERLAPTARAVHDFGLRLAKRRNESKSQQSKAIYCGSYQIGVGEIRALVRLQGYPEITGADVVHAIEDNEVSHCNLSIALTVPGDEDEAQGVRTAIVSQLWKVSKGPLRYEPPELLNDKNRPLETIVVPPGGEIEDRRSPLLRWLQVLRAVLARACLRWSQIERMTDVG